ncbi:hypothetical protein TheetDRAFT_2141 [Thermoanaerobacter ethanolicus JW 200]|nr:hypothetical protein TheetDRAFT_2141 [Thermoanaerobacter ethanolicus JW 200]
MQAEILKAIQTISNPFLDYFFIAVTMLGSSGFYFILDSASEFTKCPNRAI